MTAPSVFDYETNTWGDGYIPLGRTGDFSSLQLDWILRQLKKDHARVLEVGCGEGRLIRTVGRLRPHLAVSGMDISRTALGAALTYPEAVSYVRADGAHLPYEDRSFDVVMCCHVLEHLFEPDAAIAEIWRVLRPGGLAVVAVPCEGNRGTLHYRLRNTWVGSLRLRLDGHVQKFTCSDLLARFTGARFRIKGVRYTLHWIGQVADVYRDVLLADSLRSRKDLDRGKSFRDLLDPRIAALAILNRLAYYESLVFQRCKLGALCFDLLAEKVEDPKALAAEGGP